MLLQQISSSPLTRVTTVSYWLVGKLSWKTELIGARGSGVPRRARWRKEQAAALVLKLVKDTDVDWDSHPFPSWLDPVGQNRRPSWLGMTSSGVEKRLAWAGESCARGCEDQEWTGRLYLAVRSRLPFLTREKFPIPVRRHMSANDLEKSKTGQG